MKHLAGALPHLCIVNCEKLDLSGEKGKDNSQLQTLYVEKLPQLVTLPKWLQGSANTLKTMEIVDCPNFVAVPLASRFHIDPKALHFHMHEVVVSARQSGSSQFLGSPEYWRLSCTAR
ncbi:Disease resistance protein [Quillaja saponaria]|uniref:Disease resistance protein n=1 Tax=Quillaja saponaria TaxID=32244 RepID=A0AAD7Q8D8_QUISA|nr:Disease resistance protein [Quillaja saponaria]